MTTAKKKKKKTRKQKSVENKRAWAEKREREAAERKTAKKSIKKKAAKKPAVEKSEVATTPWPRAGDNKEFEDLLDRPESVRAKDAAGPKEPEDAALKTSDVAEWVKWPFQLWSSSQNLPPIIEPKEAIEIAEPLTRIMNRHGVFETIPPDIVDGMLVVGRTIPVIKHGNDIVKLERQRRAKAGPRPAAPTKQGTASTKPIEV